MNILCSIQNLLKSNIILGVVLLVYPNIPQKPKTPNQNCPSLQNAEKIYLQKPYSPDSKNLQLRRNSIFQIHFFIRNCEFLNDFYIHIFSREINYGFSFLDEQMSFLAN